MSGFNAYTVTFARENNFPQPEPADLEIVMGFTDLNVNKRFT